MQLWQIEMQQLKDKVEQVKKQCELVRNNMPKLQQDDQNLCLNKHLAVHISFDPSPISDFDQINSGVSESPSNLQTSTYNQIPVEKQGEVMTSDIDVSSLTPMTSKTSLVELKQPKNKFKDIKLHTGHKVL